MSVKPIDIVKTQEVAQYKHMELQRAQHAQEQISKDFHTMIDEQHNKTQETNKSDNPEYRYDAKEKGSNGYCDPNEKRKEKKEEEKKDSKEPTKNGGFDMLI